MGWSRSPTSGESLGVGCAARVLADAPGSAEGASGRLLRAFLSAALLHPLLRSFFSYSEGSRSVAEGEGRSRRGRTSPPPTRPHPRRGRRIGWGEWDRCGDDPAPDASRLHPHYRPLNNFRARDHRSDPGPGIVFVVARFSLRSAGRDGSAGPQRDGRVAGGQVMT